MNYAKIYSPYPLNDKQKNKLIKAIKQYYKMDVKIVNIIDKNLIGESKLLLTLILSILFILTN